MRIRNVFLSIVFFIILVIFGIMMKNSSNNQKDQNSFKIIFLHHSTGDVIKKGGETPIRFIHRFIRFDSYISKWFKEYNRLNNTNYILEDQYFPKREPYGWNNYPFDYYNIWVKNAGDEPYLEEPTLEILTMQYDLIIFKHCFPVSNIEEDINLADINSSEKRIENYKLQYIALKKKFHEFPNTKFLLWTGAAQVESKITKEQAQRAKSFFDWVRNEWDTPNDNIFIWDFYELETEGSLYLKQQYARNSNDSHPNKMFAKKVAPLLAQRIIDLIENNN